jgi:hypothetical protein
MHNTMVEREYVCLVESIGDVGAIEKLWNVTNF